MPHSCNEWVASIPSWMQGCSDWLQGYHGDTSAMFYVGEVSAEAQRLCEVTKLAMEEGIQQCRPGVKVSSIGKVRCQVCCVACLVGCLTPQEAGDQPRAAHCLQ